MVQTNENHLDCNVEVVTILSPFLKFSLQSVAVMGVNDLLNSRIPEEEEEEEEEEV